MTLPKLPAAMAAILAVGLLGSCTERRTASTPVADGDTIEVVIPAPATKHPHSRHERVIVIGPEARNASGEDFGVPEDYGKEQQERRNGLLDASEFFESAEETAPSSEAIIP